MIATNIDKLVNEISLEFPTIMLNPFEDKIGIEVKPKKGSENMSLTYFLADLSQERLYLTTHPNSKIPKTGKRVINYFKNMGFNYQSSYT